MDGSFFGLEAVPWCSKEEIHIEHRPAEIVRTRRNKLPTKIKASKKKEGERERESPDHCAMSAG